MKRPNSKTHTARAGAADQWRSRWLLSLVPIALGGVILVATATTGHLLSGLIWSTVLACLGALLAIAGRLEATRRGDGLVDDERAAIISTRAMSIVGTVLVITITGCTVFTLVRGENTSPWTTLLAVAGTSYVIASVALRKKDS